MELRPLLEPAKAEQTQQPCYQGHLVAVVSAYARRLTSYCGTGLSD
jgi:hypothetical protein